jgi:hypothetical protein
MNDTGSNVVNLFPSDLVQLNYNQQTYGGQLGPRSTLTGNGIVQRQHLLIEMQILKADGTIVSPWFVEHAVVMPPPTQLGALPFRLSGDGMRNHLYFATAPGNATLYVAQKKHGVMDQLPVV